MPLGDLHLTSIPARHRIRTYQQRGNSQVAAQPLGSPESLPEDHAPLRRDGILTRRTMPGQGGVLSSTVSSARSPASKPRGTKCSRWPFETGTRFMDGPPAVGPQGEPATLDPGLVPAVDALTPLRRSSYPPWRIT